MKKWLENFWYHYKVETIIGVSLFLFIIFSVKSCMIDKKPDLLVTYIGQNGVDYMIFEENREFLSSKVGDLNNDGVNYIELSPNIFSQSLSSPNDTGVLQSAATKMITGNSRLFLIEENLLKFYTERGLFAPLDEIFPQIEGAIYEDNHMVLVPLAKSENVKKFGLLPDNLYAGVRVVTIKEESNEDVLKEHEGAISLLKYLLDGVK